MGHNEPKADADAASVGPVTEGGLWVAVKYSGAALILFQK